MSITEKLYGSMVFNDSEMKARLPKDTYKAMKACIAEDRALDTNIANVVAKAMKEWAIEKGATHYTHWFQPMTGITAEKHDSFISPEGDDKVIMEFSGKELIKGEPDASSFPSGGLRATFEARGYTAWDPTSYAFVKDDTLCIPTAFCSYGGEALDKKTPLLRSMELINDKTMRLLRLFKMDDVKRVYCNVGAEQEYFLIDRKYYNSRKDLTYCGRTLMGGRPPKGQEMDDHYFGAIKPRVKEFMNELDCELWKLGVLAKTEHNEAAPAQHELAPIYETVNVACDQNQLVMEMMKRIATRHSLVCLLHEKPFKGVNGSGKHNNWSLSTDTGVNLFKPGKKPHENKLFLIMLAAVLRAVDEHQGLLRATVASAGNDHRLGAHEAPPAIVSIFLGDKLTEILESIEGGKEYLNEKMPELEIEGAHVLPHLKKDSTDRNRTSPFAFTGNKFEFRMLGSSLSIADPNVVLNTIVSEVLDDFCNRLENAEDFSSEVFSIVRDTYKAHKRIVFNGDGYSEEWKKEAKKRGLLNLSSTVDALPMLISDKTIGTFSRYGVFSRTELESRYEIMLENYSKTINIEALTMLDMVKKDVMPAVSAYTSKLADAIVKKKAALKDCGCKLEEGLLKKLSAHADRMYDKVLVLEQVESRANSGDALQTAKYYHDTVLKAMEELRVDVDEIEMNMSALDWPYSSYGQLLFDI